MYHLAAKTHSLRMVMLLVAAVMLAGWLVALCETHEEHCHAMCACALPCCQAAVLSGDQISVVLLDVTGSMLVADQATSYRSIAPIIRPPKA